MTPPLNERLFVLYFICFCKAQPNTPRWHRCIAHMDALKAVTA